MRILFWLSRFVALSALAAGIPVCASAQGAPEESGADQLDAKMGAYVECYNQLEGSAHRTIDRYASWVKDMKSGPTGRENIVYGLYQLSTGNIAECQGKFAEARKLKPGIPLDNFGVEYIKALGDLGQVVDEMYPYYDREDYKDDKFAKGKQFHPRFVTQINQFRAASEKFSTELEVENDKRLEAQMALVEQQEGRKLTYLKMAAMHRAKILVRVVAKENAAADDIAARMDAFEKAADELAQFTKANPNGLPMMWSMYASRVEEFRKAAKERMRRVRDKTPYSQGDLMMINAGSGWMISGTPEKVVKGYNDLVSSSNGLR